MEKHISGRICVLLQDSIQQRKILEITGYTSDPAEKKLRSQLSINQTEWLVVC